MLYLLYPNIQKQNYIISNLYLILILDILYNIKYNLKFFNNINTIYKIKFYLFILITKIDINSIDTIQHINNILKIILKIHINYIDLNLILNFNVILFILPIIFNNVIIINGLYKTCIQLFRKFNKIFIVKLKKNNKNIYYIYLYINISCKIIFEYINNEFYCYINNIKIHLVLLLYYLNIIKNINIYMINFNNFFKKILIYNYIKFLNLIKYKFNFNMIINSKLYYLKYLLLNNYNFKKILIIILKLLFSIKYNYKYYNSYILNNIYNKQYYSIINILEHQSKKYLKLLQYSLLYFQKTLDIKILLKYNKYINLIFEYININPLIQYTDQTNVLTEINQRFKINMITTGITSKFINNNSIRELPRNILGYLSLINTNEGFSCGLINYLLSNIFLNFKYKLNTYYLFINYHKYNYKQILDIFSKNFYNISFNNLCLKKNIIFNRTNILSINKNTFKLNSSISTNTIYIPFHNLLSIIENLIPFIHYNDPIRNLMSIKMHTQIVPIIYPTLSNIITNYNFLINKYLNYILISYQEGIVIYVSFFKIIIRDIFNRQIIYYLNNYKKLNQTILYFYKPIVWIGEKINIGQILAINSNFLYSEYNLGHNLLVGYGSYYGYEYEDAIILNKKILYNNLYTSLHFTIYEISINIINNIPELCSINLSKMYYNNKKSLDKYGIIKEGIYILTNNILVSKLILMPFIFTNINLINIINFLFGYKLRVIQNKPIISSIYDNGRILKIEMLPVNILSKSNIMTYLTIRIYIGTQHYLQIGDKICNRHGHKGVISYITNNIDMPFSNMNLQPDLLLSAVSIPSRINIGQLFEGIYGLSSVYYNIRYIISNNMNKLYYNNYINIYNNYKYNYYNTINFNKISYNFNKFYFKNPYTGSLLSNSICLNSIYYYKLIHMVKTKFRYRFIGLYSEITQQPIKGQTKHGGQRFGEMEVWALEAFGTSFLFKEFFTYKSDDIKSRKILHNYLFNNNKFKYTFISETFKLILKELQSLALNIETFCIIPNTITNKLLPLSINILY